MSVSLGEREKKEKGKEQDKASLARRFEGWLVAPFDAITSLFRDRQFIASRTASKLATRAELGHVPLGTLY